MENLFRFRIRSSLFLIKACCKPCLPKPFRLCHPCRISLLLLLCGNDIPYRHFLRCPDFQRLPPVIRFRNRLFTKHQFQRILLLNPHHGFRPAYSVKCPYPDIAKAKCHPNFSVRIRNREKKAANRQLWLGGLCCGAALAMASNFQQAGMVAGTDSGKAGFLTALYVVLVPVCGLFFKRKVSLPVWIAVALSVIALYLLCINGEFSLAPGDLLILACAVCFTIHILVIDHFTATVDGVKLSCLQFLFAALISTVCMFLFEDVDFAAIWGCILPLLYVGIFSCGVGYTLQILAQKGSNPTVVTILLSLESVFAVIAGAIILKQQMSVREYIGCAVMFAAVLLAQIDFPVKQKAE